MCDSYSCEKKTNNNNNQFHAMINNECDFHCQNICAKTFRPEQKNENENGEKKKVNKNNNTTAIIHMSNDWMGQIYENTQGNGPNQCK